MNKEQAYELRGWINSRATLGLGTAWVTGGAHSLDYTVSVRNRYGVESETPLFLTGGDLTAFLEGARDARWPADNREEDTL